jgi:tRNA U34 5-methylaminomethyl-2-thiouridine-forming methyltransferase MnmC
LKREIIQTQDGSTTIHLPEWNESYHSKHGAIQEAYHVFIKNGLSLFEGQSVSILEIGFGTGLNAFITYLEAKRNANQTINYVGVEAYPVALEEALQMNYASEIEANESQTFELMHQSGWEVKNAISTNFTLTKRQQLMPSVSECNPNYGRKRYLRRCIRL